MFVDLDGGDHKQPKYILFLVLDNINGTTEFEEAFASRHIVHVEVELKDVSIDMSQRILSLSGGDNKA